MSYDDLMPDGFGRSKERQKERPDLSPNKSNGLKVSDHQCPECGTQGWDAAIYPDGGLCDNWDDCDVRIYNRETGKVVSREDSVKRSDTGE